VNYISVTWFFKMVVDQNQKARKEAVETFANTVPLSLSQVKIPREVLACMCVHVGISLSLSLSLSLSDKGPIVQAGLKLMLPGKDLSSVVCYGKNNIHT
jgi:hypothetical protein